MKSTVFKLQALFLVILLSVPAFATPVKKETKINETTIAVVRIHYHRQAGDYSDLALWVWDDCRNPPKKWPADALSPSGQSDFGLYFDVELIENAKKISFLVVNKANGEKEAGNKVFYMTNAHDNLWIREKDDSVYVSSDFAEKCSLASARIMASDSIELVFAGKVALEPEKMLSLISVSDANGQPVKTGDLKIDQKKASLKAEFDLGKVPLRLVFDDEPVTCDLSWQMIDELYAYDGNDLGCTMLSSDSARLKLWAPRATSVRVNIFAAADQTRQIASKSLVLEGKGVWTTLVDIEEIPETDELKGCYYQYEVKNPGMPPKKVLDPYARSMAAVTVAPDGDSAGASNDFVGKAAFVDTLNEGKVPVAAKIDGFVRREDAVIYEVHVRDFTSDPEIAADLEARWGTFTAFKSRLSYIRSLGVTHIQLLPVMAWYFGDETAMNERELEYSAQNNQYNWGYDPQNYFSLDGAYSQNAEDAALRVAEFKDLVDAIHKAGMGVILDVVYTHMARADFLESIVPDYYFFKSPEGVLLGDFGNNLATNRKMSEKLVVDSVKHWFETYKIDGMRWDMMGDATRDAVQKAFDAAKAINPQAIFLGEGWRTFKGHHEDPALLGQGADQDWMEHTDSVGVFSDEFRNELKSGFGCEGEPMFLTGGKRNIKFLFNNIKAQPYNTPVTSPGDMVQYIAAHDNLPLFDVIAQSIKKDPDIAENYAEIHRRIRLGNVLLLTSQGTAFVHAGQEFGRSKQWRAAHKPEHKFHEMADAEGKPFKYPYFIHDSYDSSDAINRICWKKATDASAFPINVTTREYTSGLIQLRRSSDAFRLPDLKTVDENVKLVPAPEIAEEDLIIAYRCEASDKTIFYVFVNADSRPRKLTLKVDLSQSEVLVDQKMAGISALARPEGFKVTPDSIEIEPLTAVVFRGKS